MVSVDNIEDNTKFAQMHEADYPILSDVTKEIANKYGVSHEQIYWTVGPYDMVFIAQAPDEESITAYLLEVASAGNLRTITLRGYNREEMSGILERIG